MNRENLTRDEMLQQIAEYQWDNLCQDWEGVGRKSVSVLAATDLLIHGCRGIISYTDDELYAVWDRYFADDDCGYDHDDYDSY